MAAPKAPFDRAAFALGIRRALSMPAWIVAAAITGVGPLALDAGYPMGAAVMSTLLIWAGPAQVILFGMLAAGAPWPTIALAVGLSAVRLMPMTMTLMALLNPARPSLPVRILAAHGTTITVWVEALQRLPAMPVPQRQPYYFGFALTCIFLSAAGTALGYVLSARLPFALAASLLFVSPIFFLRSLVDGARRLADVAALVAGFALAPPLAQFVGQGSSLLLVGLVGGTGAWVLDRARRRA